MGCCTDQAAAPPGLPADPTQHVNFARGMVLGVDDMQQEFAYLSGRDHWLARDAIGYGTLSGLRVTVDDDGSEGPRLRVSAGSALTPSGRLVCVGTEQCAVVNRWLAKPANAALVNRLVGGGGSPPLSPPLSPPAPGSSGTVSLYLTLCWADCLTRPVPIPGEPCRSEDDLMQPSRVADDYRLDLRAAAAPSQIEEDALRDFARWLRDNVVPVDDDGSPPLSPPLDDEAAWAAALRSAAAAWLVPGGSPPAAVSPPASPPADYFVDLPPPGLRVSRGRVGDFLRLALRVWVTELRPSWAAMRCAQARQPDVDCVLLARVAFQVDWIGGSPSGAWQVGGSPAAVQVDDSARPLLASLRLLQEWRAATAGERPGDALDAFRGFDDADAFPDPPVSDADAATPTFDGLTTTGAVRVALSVVTSDLALDDRHHVVVVAGGHTIRLPKGSADTLGRVYVVKSSGGDSKVVADAGDAIDGPGAAPGVVKKGQAKTFVSDGQRIWHVVGGGV